MMMVTGLARSGTTLISECLDHHPEIMCISDAVNEFFKGFMRYAYYRVEGVKKTVNYPIDHFFFSGSRSVSQFVDATDFRHRVPEDLKEETLDRIAVRDGDYNPEIRASIRACKADSFDTLFIEILELLHRTYGKAGTVWFGAKATWCEQLLPALARTFPNMFFINMIRDPRAVTASHYASETTRYPLLFHVRDWRKSVYYTWKHSQAGSGIQDRFVWARYEDLVNDPEAVLSSITNAAGIEYDRAMVAASFKKPNTSHKDIGDTQGISSRFKDQWQEVLPADIVRQIELFCACEMRKMGYARVGRDDAWDVDAVVSAAPIPYESLSSWCREIVGPQESYEKAWAPANSLLELARLKWLDDRHEVRDPYPIREFFYDEDYYSFVRSDRPWPSAAVRATGRVQSETP